MFWRRHVCFLLFLITLLTALANPLSECSDDNNEACTAASTSTSSTNDYENAEATIASWFDNVTSQGLKFLVDNVFSQTEADSSEETSFAHVTGGASSSSSSSSDSPALLPTIASTVTKLMQGQQQQPSQSQQQQQQQPKLLDILLEQSRQVAAQGETSRNFQQVVQVFVDSFSQVTTQINQTVGDLGLHQLNPLAMLYYVELEDARKNPSFKRRKHRFDKRVKQETIYELHDALYLVQLSYAHTVAQVKEGLQGFKNDTWELLYCKTEALPNEPAHFIAIHKELAPLKPAKIVFPWDKTDDELDVIIVVRGTKEFGDFLSDGLLEATDYRGGKAHAGILQSGKYIAEKHLDMLTNLLDASKRKRIRLWLFGHSLGGGAAAIAAMELNDFDYIKAASVGFGSPALLSANLSATTKDYITTVVTDSDVVPRLSGASVANVLLDIMSFDWTDLALLDLQDLLQMLATNPPLDILPPGTLDKLYSWIQQYLEKEVKPTFAKVTKERLEPVLFPPGSCIHLFRDGVGYTSTYTNCSYFREVDVSRTLVDDHLVAPGYHRALLSLIRDTLNDFNFDFEHNVAGLPV